MASDGFEPLGSMAPMLGALPGQDGPFGRQPAPGEDDETEMDTEDLGPVAAVPAPTDGSGSDDVVAQPLAQARKGGEGERSRAVRPR
ncbi:hypothetical protein ACFWCB_11115 [Streptomyces sp. NPDC060048]|uniref:hypothetical protein n=1 Tax=unclassified Streptomyces TaxID=2593676 RepID=UPI0036D1A0BB